MRSYIHKNDKVFNTIEENNSSQLLLCGIDMSYLPRGGQFIVCIGGVFLFYLLYGYYQELIFSIPGFKLHGWYLTLVQFAFYTLFAAVETIFVLKDITKRIPIKVYFLLAFLTVGTMGMSNSSLRYLNYPTQVIFKCCKLIPVMLGGIFIQDKRYGVMDFISCLLMSIGLTFFILAGSTIQPNFNYIGIIMMSLALCSDAAIGNVQEKSMKLFKASNVEVVLYSYGIGFVYLLFALLISGSLVAGFQYYADNPIQSYGYTFIFSLTGYLGITFVLTLVRAFGALLAVTVTTCRKAVTIILSFVLFTKPFVFQYVWSGMIVLCGIALNIYQKNKTYIDQWFIRFLHHIHFFVISTKKSPRMTQEV